MPFSAGKSIGIRPNNNFHLTPEGTLQSDFNQITSISLKLTYIFLKSHSIHTYEHF